MEDLLEQANEIQDALARSYAVPDEIDEADLEAGMSNTWTSGISRANAIAIELDALQLEEEEEGRSWTNQHDNWAVSNWGNRNIV